MRLKSKVIAGALAVMLSVTGMAPGIAKATDGVMDEEGVYRWGLPEEEDGYYPWDAFEEVDEKIEDAKVKNVAVEYTEKANSEMKSVEATATNGKITAQFKVSADNIPRLHYTKNGGKAFTKMNMEKVILGKLGLSKDTSYSVYSMDFFGDLFTVTGYYYDKNDAVHYFVLASSDMKTFVKRDMPEIENSGNNLPYLKKIGNQYIWCARQEYASEDSGDVADYRFTYYAGRTIAKLEKKTVAVDPALSKDGLASVEIWAGVNEKTGMSLTYSGYNADGYLTDSQMLLTKDLKQWTAPISLWDDQTWSWSASLVDGGMVVWNWENDPEYAELPGDNPGLVSIRAYDGSGKEIGFQATMERLGYLDSNMSVFITTKGDAVQYITVFDRNANGCLAFTISKNGALTAQRVPFHYNDGYTDGIKLMALDTKNGVYFVSDYSGNVYMSKDGFASVVTFKAPENGEGILDFNVVGNYLIFDFPEKTYKVKLSTLYKNF